MVCKGRNDLLCKVSLCVSMVPYVSPLSLCVSMVPYVSPLSLCVSMVPYVSPLSLTMHNVTSLDSSTFIYNYDTH